MRGVVGSRGLGKVGGVADACPDVVALLDQRQADVRADIARRAVHCEHHAVPARGDEPGGGARREGAERAAAGSGESRWQQR